MALKRAVLQVSFFIYGHDDEDLKRKANEFTAKMRIEKDNGCEVESIDELPFGSLEKRKIV